jgi:Spx/MgsR family transcriptional regulator
MTVRIYGIKNCDTMKKAFDWLDQNGVAYDFHNYKTDGIDAATLKRWTKAIGWEKLVNKTGTTFKALPDTDKTDLDEAKALKLMAAHPSLIRRPVVEADGQVFAGFKPGSPERAALEAAALKG